ncbi:MAG: hypothetical protein HC895_08325 [Leptolyngbyaceae cyanobacterium SM1_3_5]|nr:hypothetical protein [Leptolyngbyaceae cyanobacterium SM1_3_5]
MIAFNPIPYRRSPHFVGRTDELAILHRSLQENQRVAVIAGWRRGQN